jgi:hypothetical protein
MIRRWHGLSLFLNSCYSLRLVLALLVINSKTVHIYLIIKIKINKKATISKGNSF